MIAPIAGAAGAGAAAVVVAVATTRKKVGSWLGTAIERVDSVPGLVARTGNSKVWTTEQTPYQNQPKLASRTALAGQSQTHTGQRGAATARCLKHRQSVAVVAAAAVAAADAVQQRLVAAQTAVAGCVVSSQRLDAAGR